MKQYPLETLSSLMIYYSRIFSVFVDAQVDDERQ